MGSPTQPVPPRLTEAQRRQLSEVLHFAILEIRALASEGNARQAADLADAVHNIPRGIWDDTFDLVFLRDSFLAPYQARYPGRANWCDYVAKIDEIRAMAR